jgi:hypothetical protein
MLETSQESKHAMFPWERLVASPTLSTWEAATREEPLSLPLRVEIVEPY